MKYSKVRGVNKALKFFAFLLLFIGGSRALADTCYTTYCACTKTLKPDSTYTDKVIYSIPFNWTHADTDTANDICSGANGTCSCNGGSSSFSTSTVTTPTGSYPGCEVTTDPKVLPFTVTCKWTDGQCYTYSVPYSC